jgi:hypothetical protein
VSFNGITSFNSNATFNNTTTQITSSGVITIDGTGGVNVAGGNVGIGKTTPAYKLDVSGTANFSGATTIGGTLALSNGNGLFLNGNGSVNCGTVGCTSINTNNGTVSVGSGAVNCGAVTCGAVSCSTLTTNGNTLTCAAVNCGAISCSTLTTNSNTLTCAAVNCSAISCSTLTTGRNTITSGSINCYDINTNSNSINVGTGAVNWGNSVSILKSNGYIGIGDTNPTYPLTIGYSNSRYSGYYIFAYQNGLGMNSPTLATEDISLHCAKGAYFTNKVIAGHFATESDSRIKNNIVDIDDSKALSILRQIQPKTYEYVDKMQRGNDSVIGFIAQEIKAILPKAVSIISKHIPNFYTVCQVAPTDVSNIVLVTSPIDLSWNPLHGSATCAVGADNASDPSGNAFIDAAGNACSDASGKKQFNVRLYDQSNNEIDCKTTDVLDKRSFLMDISGTKMVDGALQDGYFLHGQEIDDFHNLDKAAIFTVVTAAVQDIDRIVQAQAAKIIELENKNATLESLVAQQQAQINAILAKIGGV